MASSETVVFIAGSYVDAASAKYDFRAVRDSYYETNALEEFDCAVLGRQDTGKVKIFRKFERSTLHGGLVGPGWGLATGLAVALFPAAAIGTNFLVGTPGGHGGVSAFAGQVAAGVGRKDLLATGAMFDSAQAGLIAAATEAIAPLVRSAMNGVDEVLFVEALIDTDELARNIREAYREAIAQSPR